MDLNTAGIVASIAGLGATFVEWFIHGLKSRDRQANEAAAITIDDYKEWLRRGEHRHVLNGLEQSQQAMVLISTLIDGLMLQTDKTALETLRRVENSDARLEALAARLADVQKHLQLFDPEIVRSRDERSFESKYLKQIESTYGRLQMVGVPEMRQVKQRFTVAYVALNVRSSTGGQHLRGAEEALRDEKEMTIRGSAGSGKTTLLTWLALQCAQVEDAANVWKGGIPFFVPLRKMKGPDRHHPDMSQFVKYSVDPKLFPVEPPRNWLRGVLDNNRAVILIDGVDELAINDRPYFWEWVDDFSSLCQGNRMYVTSRHIGEGHWSPPSSFTNAELDEMNDVAVRQFIKNWHDAIIDIGVDESDRHELEDSRGSLVLKLRDARNQRVRDLCRTPLLCSLVCALHWREWGYLPSRRVDIYDRCCTMLIDERDRKRDVPSPEGPLRFLEYRDKEMLLQRLALDMMRNAMATNRSGQQIEVTRREAVKWIRPNIRSCDNPLARECEAEDLIDHLIVRTGLLREPSKGRVDFPHRTFQEYLAACAAGGAQPSWFSSIADTR